ncbi:MAG: hypothetical protein ACOCQM_01895 [Natronomonas sp.]
MAPTRRGLLEAAVLGTALGVAGCLDAPGRSCSGATFRLSLSPVDSVSEPLVLDPERLSAAANAMLDAAVDGEYVERCVAWTPQPDETGPSSGLRAVGERLESHAGIDLDGRTEPVAADARRDGENYRLRLDIEPG